MTEFTVVLFKVLKFRPGQLAATGPNLTRPFRVTQRLDLPVDLTIGRACPQRAESDVFHARRAARRDGLALPGSWAKCRSERNRKLPMVQGSMFDVGRTPLLGREGVGSWDVCVAPSPLQLPMNLMVGLRCRAAGLRSTRRSSSSALPSTGFIGRERQVGLMRGHQTTVRSFENASEALAAFHGESNQTKKAAP